MSGPLFHPNPILVPPPPVTYTSQNPGIIGSAGYYGYEQPGDLPVELHAEPVPGVKAAYIIPGPGGTARFAGAGNGVNFPYGVTDVMQCPLGHVSPEYHPGEMTHGCGFYAYLTPELLYANIPMTTAAAVPSAAGILFPTISISSSPYVVLQVEQYGRVVSHEYGSRAQKQRVLRATVLCCVYCGSPAVGFTVRPIPIVNSLLRRDGTCFAGACPVCPRGQVISLAQMASMLGTEVISGKTWSS